ncbi:hypothetical protein L7F22_031419 [Adiantum nelumboides]|nr:hypothetical protein [Adiantum nelumboides]
MFCLKACSSICDVNKGQEIHMELVEEGFDSGYLVGSALASGYAKCGFIEKAQGVFGELDTLKVISGTTLLTSHPLHGHACSMTGAIGKTKVHEAELHGLLKQDPILGNTWVDVWAKSGSFVRANDKIGAKGKDKSTNGTATKKFDESALDVVAKMVQRDKEDSQVGKAKEEGWDVLREVLCVERKMLAALETELEKERNAVAIATSKTMAMISRLQEEKSAMQLVVAQLQRMAEEKAEHDEHAMALLKEILFKREAKKHALEKNLIMDTLGALVLAMKPPTDDIH